MKKNITVSLILILLFSGCARTFVVKKQFFNGEISNGHEIFIDYASKPRLLQKNNLYILTRKYKDNTWLNLTINTRTNEIINSDYYDIKDFKEVKGLTGYYQPGYSPVYIFMNKKIWIYIKPKKWGRNPNQEKVILSFGNNIDSKKNFFSSVNKDDHDILKYYFEKALKTSDLYVISQYVKYARKLYARELPIYDDSLIYDYIDTAKNVDLNVVYYLWKEGFKFHFKNRLPLGYSEILFTRLPNKVLKELIKTKQYPEMLKNYIVETQKYSDYKEEIFAQIISDAIETKNTSVFKYIGKSKIIPSLVSERKFSLLKQMIENSSTDKKKLQILLLKTGNIEAYIKLFGYKCDNISIEKIIYPLLHIKEYSKIYDGVKLLKHHPDFYKYRDSNGNNLFLMAAINHNYDLLSKLSQYFKINSTNDYGKNAMDYNVHYGLCDTEIANFLTSKGLAPNKKECYPKDYGSVFYKDTTCSTSICDYTFHCGTYNMAGSKKELDTVIEAYSDSEDHVKGYSSPELTRSCDAHGEYISPLADKICRCVKNKVGLR